MYNVHHTLLPSKDNSTQARVSKKILKQIGNKNITTQDFMDYLNQSGLSQEVIKSNIDKNKLKKLKMA